MKIAIVHYHLRRGGVTNVIHSAQEALRGTDHEVLVISGEAPCDGVEFDNLAIIPGLQYRRTAYLSVAEGLTDALKEKAEKHFGSQPDVWHFHNHSLGKNVLMPLAISGLAEEKAGLLLQMHDFPEDGRPMNYVAQRSFFDVEKEFARTLYPLASHVHYATINRRDLNFLRAAGMQQEQTHHLPNSVSGFNTSTTPADRPFSKDKKFILYPTRAIRRKNLGEMLILALAYGDECSFATSLIPENPEWKPFHDHWRDLAKEMKLPISFGIAADGTHNFNDLVGWSDAMLTTSIAEGFGLAFLEPWLSDKSVVGRNLPRITNDLGNSGIHLDHLYERIEVPLDWVDEEVLRKTADNTLRRTYLAYNRPLARKAVDQAFSRWVDNGCIDFGMLNEEFQTKIIKKVAADPAALQALNVPSIEPCSDAEIAKKKHLVKEHYGIDTYRENLLSIYGKIANSSRGKVKSMEPRKVLEQFLDPWRLNLLRT
ncbi:MAG: glycosyltransferase family 4 protein [Verrucomicrobiales bacterium]|nr:glycosyltransferase family 4 protein [Verrucomicrobiales bacterium]